MAEVVARRNRSLLVPSAGLMALGVLIAACSSPKPTPAAAPAPVLWGEFKPVVSVRELMKYMIDPASDNVFNAVSSVMTKNGLVDNVPKTDEDWEKIQIGAVSLAEGIYLLKVPRPFTPPGDLNNSTGPDAVELAPSAITAKVERDPVEWNARIEALRNVALEVLEIVKKKDVAGLSGAGEDLDTACENCHRSYWYPGENLEYYQKLFRRLDEFKRQPPGTAGPATGTAQK